MISCAVSRACRTRTRFSSACSRIRPTAPPFHRRRPLTHQPRRCSRPAAMVAAGILLSRILGLVRNRVFAHYLGTSDAADAFNAAFKIPNFLQNLFGEGVLSASFIPVYARLLARGDRDEARRVAGAVLSLLALATSVLVLLGVLLTPLLITVIAPGFDGRKARGHHPPGPDPLSGRRPAGALRLVSGVLNSHRPLLPLLCRAGAVEPDHHRRRCSPSGDTAAGIGWPQIAAWGSVAGSALQFGVQLPTVLSF